MAKNTLEYISISNTNTTNSNTNIIVHNNTIYKYDMNYNLYTKDGVAVTDDDFNNKKKDLN